MSTTKRRTKGGSGRKDKKAQANRQDNAARKAGDEAARPKTRSGAPKAAKPGHQPSNPGRGEQARVGRHARKPSGTEVREGRQDSIGSLNPNQKVDRAAAALRSGGTGKRG